MTRKSLQLKKIQSVCCNPKVSLRNKAIAVCGKVLGEGPSPPLAQCLIRFWYSQLYVFILPITWLTQTNKHKNCNPTNARWTWEVCKWFHFAPWVSLDSLLCPMDTQKHTNFPDSVHIYTLDCSHIIKKEGMPYWRGKEKEREDKEECIKLYMLIYI